jgi:YVTN family beta-propeller protein
MNWVDQTRLDGELSAADAEVPGNYYPKDGVVVMFDVGKVLQASGRTTNAGASNSAYVVDFNGQAPVVTQTGSMQNARTFSNGVVLPNGEVMVIGGNTSQQGFSDEGSVLTPEIWNPSTGQWRAAANASVPRNYHSLAALLPDGRVWSGGGGLSDTNLSANHQDAQIYTPGCLFNADGSLATRPVISEAPASIVPGVAFSVKASPGMKNFTFIKLSSLTHSIGTDLRFLNLSFTEGVPGNYTVQPHANTNVMTPGYWMLFAVSPSGPYSVSKIIHVPVGNGLVVEGPAFQTLQINQSFSLPMTATGGGTLTWSATGLPPGLSINATTGLVSGTPSALGVFRATISARSSLGFTGSMEIPFTVVPPTLGRGSILREWWLNIDGNSIANLTSNPAYPNSPAGRDTRTTFEAPTNWADNYGTRMRGWIHPPVTGQYRFWIAGDNEAELFLSTNDSGDIATPICRVPDWSNSREWAKYPDQASVLITLQAGQRYYIEALMKEGVGGDNLAVAWEILGANSGPVVIGGQYLTPWPVNLPPDPLTLGALTGAPAPVNTPVTFTVAAAGGGNPQFKWSFGDGSADTAFSSSRTATKTYANPGRYLVTVTALDATGKQVTSSFHQGVHAALTAAQPRVSSTMAYQARSGANARLWVVNPDQDSVTVFDAVTNARSGVISTGSAPRSVAIASDGNAWVVNSESASISIINASLNLVQTVAMPRGSRPYGIVFDPTGNTAYVSLQDTGRVVKIARIAPAAIAGTAIVGSDVRHLSISADGAKLFASRFITPKLPGEETGGVSTENGPTKFGGQVSLISTATMAVAKTMILQHSNDADTSTGGRGIPNYLGPAVISPDGRTAWVPSKKDNIKRGRLRDNRPLTHDSAVRSISSRIDLATEAEDFGGRIDYDDGGIAVTGCYEPKGIYFFAALEGSREVAIVDSWAKREVRRFVAGRAPQGVVTSPDGRTLFVHNFMDRTVTVHDVSPLIDGAGTDPKLTATLHCITTEKLAAHLLIGKQLFYDAADPRLASQKYISCASCHNDGGQDGRVWDFTGFGEGLRNNISLKGHANHGPVHWTGNFDEIQDFERQIRSFAGGAGLLNPGDVSHPPLGMPNALRSADLDALAAYVNSLTTTGNSPHRNANGTLTADAVAGQTLFKQLNCASCHSGPRFTDSALNVLHDIGTIRPTSGKRLDGVLTGLDTPTLRGLWNTAPYLHDGRAGTLGEAVSAHQGVTLTAEQTNRLAAYLSQIGDSTVSAPAPLNIVLSTASTAVSGVFAVTGTLSEGPIGFAEGDISVDGGTLSGFTRNGTTFSFNVTPSKASLQIKIAAGTMTDSAGVANLESNTLRIDYTRPGEPTRLLLQVEDFDAGAQGVAYNDTDAANHGRIHDGLIYRSGGVDITRSRDEDGTPCVGWTAPGEWLSFTKNLSPGTYRLSARAATEFPGTARIRVMVNGSSVGTFDITSTGGWHKWQTFKIPNVSITASGRSTIRIEFLNGAVNLNWIRFNENRPEEPAKLVLQAEDFDPGAQGVAYNDGDSVNHGFNNGGFFYRNGGVDITGSRDEDDTPCVGWTAPGEWLRFTKNLSPGTYTLSARAATEFPGTTRIRVRVNGSSVGTFSITSTGGWHEWQTFKLPYVSIAASGSSAIRIEFPDGAVNLNWVRFISTATSDSTKASVALAGAAVHASAPFTMKAPNEVRSLTAQLVSPNAKPGDAAASNLRSALAGTYDGLLEPTLAPEELATQPALAGVFEGSRGRGLLSATVSRAGAVTGRLSAGGTGQTFKGVLKGDGTVVFSGGAEKWALKKTQGRVVTALGELVLRMRGGAPGKLVGELTAPGGSTVMARLAAEKHVYSAAKVLPQGMRRVPESVFNRAYENGRYTALFEPVVDEGAETNSGVAKTAFPQGAGSGLMTVSEAGVVRLVGRLPDGATISYANRLSPTLGWSVYAALYGGRGFVTGRVQFDAAQAGIDAACDAMKWVRPAGWTPPYRAGWPDGIALGFAASKDAVPASSANPSSVFGPRLPVNAAQ